jgi:hypothetical protein
MTKKTGSFHGKSNKLGYGGRAAQLRAQGVPGAVIGAIAPRKHRPLTHDAVRGGGLQTRRSRRS